ncbi:hypothetical protein DFH07DRAFT_880916 [Mycena maculata]|uniref:Uncharacterized protein n=1 Tax=Mycena maculata TaxID=230809 RepID=A0AAD7JNX4_9AGAR|nr:hypothetical protein DFH07DRAFT_880916 [Mycena maculata]
MSVTEAAVLQNASYHMQLLDVIAELDYVPSALTQQNSYIASLEAEREQTVAKIAVLEKKTTKERKEHEALRDSTARRLAHKLTGRKEKFEAKASKEEREYVEALGKEIQEKRQLETLETMLAEAKAVRINLLEKAERHRLTKDDLEKLYSDIFDGVTQGYPEDDRLEQQLAMAQGRYNQIQAVLNKESQALNLLNSANSSLAACRRQVKEALGYSEWDVLGGGTMTDIMERDSLSTAQQQLNQTQLLVQQAISASQQVQPVGEFQVAHGSIISDVLFDNIFTDLAFHDKIKATARNVEEMQLKLTEQIRGARARTNAVGADLDAAAEHLTRARAALDTFRRNVFDRLSGAAPPLPSYSEISEPVVIEMPLAPGESRGGNMPRPFPGGSPPPGGMGQPSSYAPPAGPPPSLGGSPSAPSGASSSGMPRTSPSPSPAPPSAPSPSGSSYAPPPGPPPGHGAPPQVSAWGSRNPYAAALAGGTGRTAT